MSDKPSILNLDSSVLKSLSVLICQNRTCRQQGAEKVLAAFLAHPVTGVMVSGSSCLGQCGNGPIVLVKPDSPLERLPESVWYGAVHPEEVATVVERHLKQGCPVKAMLYRPKSRKR